MRWRAQHRVGDRELRGGQWRHVSGYGRRQPDHPVDDHGDFYVDNWPQNPWGGGDMVEHVSEGNYDGNLQPGDTLTLVGLGSEASPVITAP